MDFRAQIVLCNCPDMGTAEEIGRLLVSSRLAAAVNLVPCVKSIYRWDGEVKEHEEVILLIKTSTEHFPLLEERIRSIHPFETPGIIAVPVAAGTEAYLRWIEGSSNKQ